MSPATRLSFLRGLVRRPKSSEVVVPLPPRKEDAECCNAHRDDLGRLPIGYCSPGCTRRHDLPDDAA